MKASKGSRDKASCILLDLSITGRQKAIPLQTWTGPVGSRMLRLPDFKTIDT